MTHHLKHVQKVILKLSWKDYVLNGKTNIIRRSNNNNQKFKFEKQLKQKLHTAITHDQD